MAQAYREVERVVFQGSSPIHWINAELIKYGMYSLCYEDFLRTKYVRTDNPKVSRENVQKADDKNAIVKRTVELFEQGGYFVFPADWKGNVPLLIRDEHEMPQVTIQAGGYQGPEPFCVKNELDDNLYIYIPPHTAERLVFSHPEDNRYIDIQGLPNGTFNYMLEGIAAYYSHTSLSYSEQLNTVSYFAYDLARLNQARQVGQEARN